MNGLDNKYGPIGMRKIKVFDGPLAFKKKEKKTHVFHLYSAFYSEGVIHFHRW